MKVLVYFSMIMLMPILLNAQGVRFTDKYGPFYQAHTQTNDFTNRKIVQYPNVRDADVMMEKVTWELIDLREKMNLPLYYPTDTIHNRFSLVQAMLEGIRTNQFNAFKTPLQNNKFEFDQNNMFFNFQDLLDINKREEVIPIEIMPGVNLDSLVTIRWRPEEIKQILVKEVWYFDKKDSRLRSEIIGLCPIREYVYNGQLMRQRLFWVYYPDMRNFLGTIPVYNPLNDKPLYSFDDLLVNRYFSSYFIQEANVYNDRMITDYRLGRDAQLESQRIKNEIFDWEQDLWEN